MPIPQFASDDDYIQTTTGSTPGLVDSGGGGGGGGSSGPQADWTDEQMLEWVLSQGDDAYISDAGVFTFGTPGDVEKSNEAKTGVDLSGNPLDPAALKPDLKPAPIKRPKKAKLKDTLNPYMDPAGLLAEIMSMSGKPLESTNRSRYSPVEEGVPELETPRDDWSGLLQTLLEDKKRKEAMALASSRRLG